MSARRPWIGVAAACALGLIAWLAWARAERGTRAVPRPVAAEVARAEPEGAPELARPGLADARPPAREPAKSRSVEAEHALELRVLHGPNGAPAAGAEVFLIDWGVAVRARELDRRGGLERLLERLALRRISDSVGKARFPIPRGSALAAARLGERFAAVELERAEPGPVVLTLASDPPVRVRVTDALGAPLAGVDVAMGSAKRARDLVRVATGPDGVATLFAREHRAELVRDGARVALAVPLFEQVEAAVDLEHVPREPLELALPDVGSVEVVLVDEYGAEPDEPVHVWAELSARMEAELGEHAGRFRGLERWAQSARVRLWPVGLGLELRFGADGEEREECSAVAEGPRNPGEDIQVRLVLEPPLPIVTGRIVDPEGRALGPATLSVLARRGRSASGRSCFVGADGRFRCALAESIKAERLELEVTAPGREAQGEVLDPRLGPGETDLGDIVLAPVPLLLSGTVRDESGAPVRGAQLNVSYTQPPQGANGFPLRADALGRFEVRKSLPGVVTLALWAQAEGFQMQRLAAIPVGSSGLELVLVRGGWIVGRLELVVWLMPTLELTRGRELVQAGQSWFPGGFRVGPMPAGRYTLSCGYPWSEAKVVIDGLDVVPGQETRDPRLDPLDLRALLPVVNLNVVDEHGAPVPDVVVGLRRTPGELENLYARRSGDIWRVAAGPLPLALHIESPGFRALDIEADSDRRVVLERGIPLRLVIAGALPELPDGWTLEARLIRQGPLSLASPAPEVAFQGGVAEPCVSLPGSYECSVVLVQRHGGEELDRSSWWDHGFEVAEGTSAQVFLISAPSQELVGEMLAYIEENR